MHALRRFDDPSAFEEHALGWLMGSEAEHNLMIGLAARLRRGEYGDQAPYLAVVERGGEVVACALRTPGPPNQLLLSHVDDTAAIDVIARDHYDFSPWLSALLAGREAAEVFVDRWRHLSGRGAVLGMRQGIHECSRVRNADGVWGHMRAAAPEDRELLVDWMVAFAADVGERFRSPHDAREHVEGRIASETAGLVVWEDGRPVSFAGFSSPTPNGIRLGPVYTPTELRGRGYASGCVASLTQRLLDEGRRFVFLYTDLANPTSNRIYRRIGYELVSEVEQYRFA